jgi:hypothetical protein
MYLLRQVGVSFDARLEPAARPEAHDFVRLVLT